MSLIRLTCFQCPLRLCLGGAGLQGRRGCLGGVEEMRPGGGDIDVDDGDDGNDGNDDDDDGDDDDGDDDVADACWLKSAPVAWPKAP